LLLIIFDIPSNWINRAVSGASYDVISVGIIFPLVVMFGNNARAGALAVALGTLSYPLYAIHFPLLQVMHAFPLSLMEALIGITCLVIVAWAIGRWVDGSTSR
jgi:peptidoglycan/LPS O-acetylase OafA/YrhL